MKTENIVYWIVSVLLIFFSGGLGTKNNYNDFWIVLFAGGLLFGICALESNDKWELNKR